MKDSKKGNRIGRFIWTSDEGGKYTSDLRTDAIAGTVTLMILVTELVDKPKSKARIVLG